MDSWRKHKYFDYARKNVTNNSYNYIKWNIKLKYDHPYQNILCFCALAKGTIINQIRVQLSEICNPVISITKRVTTESYSNHRNNLIKEVKFPLFSIYNHPFHCLKCSAWKVLVPFQVLIFAIVGALRHYVQDHLQWCARVCLLVIYAPLHKYFLFIFLFWAIFARNPERRHAQMNGGTCI